MIIQLFAYAEWTATGILAFLLGLARRRIRFVRTTDRRGVRQELVGMRKMMRLDRSSARRALFAVPLWACAAVPAFAEQQEATIVLGAGQKTCGEYLAVVYCFGPEGELPIGDVMLAQKIALENNEQAVLALANRGNLHQSPSRFG
jgi:hypothetical protein